MPRVPRPFKSPTQIEALEARLLLSNSSNLFDITAAGYLGGAGNDDGVRGAVIESDGTVVLAANIGDATPGGLSPVLLNGATSTSSGAIIRMSADGTTILSVTRLANKVLDLSEDAAGNLYVALYDGGAAKLTADASTLLWAKSTTDLGFANVQRIDAGPGGYCVVLGGGSLDSSSTLGDYVGVFAPDGTSVGGWNSTKWKNDVAIDETSQTIVTIGYRNATDSASGLPVQISYYRGSAYDGTTKYNGYDWSGDASDPTRYINAPTNNMADTRGYRAEIGDDGKLYLGFESAGGNFIFRYDPFNIMTPVSMAGGDAWNSAYNDTSNHLTIFGRYEPSTGAYIANQELACRLGDDSANTLRMEGGNINADADGHVYLVGYSAWGLPLPTHPNYTFNAAAPGFNPGTNGNYLGGSYLVIMSSNLSSRLYTTRLTGGRSRAVAVRALPGDSFQIAFGGETSTDTYLVNAGQTALSGTQDGWYGVIADSAGEAANHAPSAVFAMNYVASGSGTVTLELNASGSTDADADPLTYLWHFSDGATAEGGVVQHVFTAGVNCTVTLTVLDDSSGWSTESKTFGPPVASFSMSTRAVDAPAQITFDASKTTDPDDDPATLTYTWDFGDGATGAGRTAVHTYSHGGVYTITLTVADSLGGVSTRQDILGVAGPGGYQKRLDFGADTSTVAAGFTLVPLVAYTPQLGFGWQHLTGDYNTGSDGPDDPLYGDYHQFSKYPTSSEDGTFLVDLPNGTYTVLARFGNKYSTTFPAVMAEGVRETSSITAGSGTGVTKVFKVNVTDGQLNLILEDPQWFISGLEIIDIGPAMQQSPDTSFDIDLSWGEAPMRVAFDASGGSDVNPGALSYAWDFGDSTTGSGAKVSHTYATPGVYTVTLTVTGGSSARIVNFGGDYVSSNSTISCIRSQRGVDADGDGLADDTITGIDFSLEPSAPILSVGSGTLPSGRIYGGMVNFQIDNPTGNTSFADYSLTNNAADDYFNLRDQATAPIVQHRALMMWIKDEFTNGAHAQRVYFDSSSQMSVSLKRWENLAAGHWVVQDGDQFYVSQATFSGTGVKTLNPNATTWALYAPIAPYAMDFDQDNAVYAAHTFTDIRAVGILGEQDGKAGGGRVWYQVDGFTCDAAWATTTATVTVVAPLPRVQVTASAPLASENAGNPGQFTLTRTGSTAEAMTVNYSIGGTGGAWDYDTQPVITGSIVIPAGSASATLSILPVDDTESEGNETVVLTLRPGDGYFPGDARVATVTIQDNEGPFVNFGGDYGTAGATLKPSEGGGAGTQTIGDFDADGATDDVMRSYSFSTTTPLSPNIVSGVYSGPSAKFYGGIVGIACNATSKTFDNHSVSNGTSGDYIDLRFQTGTGATNVQFDSVFVWQADGFVNGNPPFRMGSKSTFTATFLRFENLGSGRFVLGDGTNLYVSQKTFTGNVTWTGQEVADSMWALYAPSGTNIDFDQNAAVFNIPIYNIQVRSAGLLTDRDNGPTARYWLQLSKFSVDAGDNVTPKVVEAARTPAARPDQLDGVSFRFSEDVVSSIDAGDLTLFDKTTQAAVDLSAATFSYDRATKTASWNLAALNLPAGRYEARLAAAGIVDMSGNALDGDADGFGGDDYVYNVLKTVSGDINADGNVDVIDLGILATNYGASAGANWSTGDLSGDAAVDVVDLGLLATNYGTAVGNADAVPAASALSSPAVETLSVAASMPTVTDAPLSAPTTVGTSSGSALLYASVPAAGIQPETASVPAESVDILTISSRVVMQTSSDAASESPNLLDLDVLQVL